MMPRKKRTLESIAKYKEELNIVNEDIQLRDLIASNRSKKYNVNDIFPIKKIRAHEWRVDKKSLTLYYLVQWDGLYAASRFDSWEPSYNFHPNQLAEYHAQQNINPTQLEKQVKQLLAIERRLLKQKQQKKKLDAEFHKEVAQMDVESLVMQN